MLALKSLIKTITVEEKQNKYIFTNQCGWARIIAVASLEEQTK